VGLNPFESKTENVEKKRNRRINEGMPQPT
jgi:hypothetical protein